MQPIDVKVISTMRALAADAIQKANSGHPGTPLPSLEHNDTYLVAKGDEGINSLMLCAGAYYSACNGIQVKLPVGAEDYSRLMEELIMKEKSIKNNI